MKLKRIIYVIVIAFLIISIITLSIKIFKIDNHKTTIIGNTIENIDDETDDTFTSNFMTSSLLLKMLTNDASKERNGKLIKLSKLIDASDKIIINVGLIDLCNYIKEEDSLIYDETILNRQSEITISNISSIVNIVNTKCKKTKIVINELVYPYSIKDDKLLDIFNEINDKIRKIIDKYKTNINDLSFLVSINIFIEKVSKMDIIYIKEWWKKWIIITFQTTHIEMKHY